MRAIWSGEISFGLVEVPVKLYSATRSHDVSFHQVHDKDGGRIRYERRCDVCNRKIDYDHIEKAFDDGDKTVILSDEELDALPAEENDEIEVVQFVPGDQIDPLLLGTAYYLEPVGKSPKAYALLRRTLDNSDLTAVVRFTLRSKTRLGVLRTRGDLLTLQTLRWPEDVREVDFPQASKKPRISEREAKAAAALVDQFAGDFDPGEFHDDYQEELRELIQDKLDKGDTLDTSETFGKSADDGSGDEGEKKSGKVLSLMDALEGSLSKRGGGAKKESAETAKKASGASKKSSASSGKSSSGAKKSSSSSSKASSGAKKASAGKKTAASKTKKTA